MPFSTAAPGSRWGRGLSLCQAPRSANLAREKPCFRRAAPFTPKVPDFPRKYPPSTRVVIRSPVGIASPGGERCPPRAVPSPASRLAPTGHHKWQHDKKTPTGEKAGEGLGGPRAFDVKIFGGFPRFSAAFQIFLRRGINCVTLPARGRDASRCSRGCQDFLLVIFFFYKPPPWATSTACHRCAPSPARPPSGGSVPAPAREEEMPGNVPRCQHGHLEACGGNKPPAPPRIPFAGALHPGPMFNNCSRGRF